jgi:hypothetical protein
MPDQYGLDRKDENGTYLEGPLKGQTSVNALIDEQTTAWLKHASDETGYSLDRLVEISAQEAALNHAKNNNLI